jgi:hypothetical protein
MAVSSREAGMRSRRKCVLPVVVVVLDLSQRLVELSSDARPIPERLTFIMVGRLSGSITSLIG